jgi:hypothetical protein
MGAAIDFLHQHGLTARANGERIVVSPASRLTDDVRQYVRAHRLALLAELAANDRQERRTAWHISRESKPLCMLIGEPMTYAEALEIARWHWRDVEVFH